VLTLQILTRNNASTREKCLESVRPLESRIYGSDMGSDDSTREICKSFGAEVTETQFRGNLSDIRNEMVAEGANFYLEPWEILARGHEELAAFGGNAAVYVVASGVVSKQVRLWRDGRFTNPVFEHVDVRAEVRPDIVVVANGQHPDERRRNTEACRRWADSKPTSPEPHYYLACSRLAEGDIDGFLIAYTKHMSLKREGDESSLLMDYYFARAKASKGAFEEASRKALKCIAAAPSFAEFWCLMGDMLFSRGKYQKARHMYENARIAGRMRPSDDLFPVELSKYGEYPREMERRCLEAEKASVLVSSGVPRRDR